MNLLITITKYRFMAPSGGMFSAPYSYTVSATVRKTEHF